MCMHITRVGTYGCWPHSLLRRVTSRRVDGTASFLIPASARGRVGGGALPTFLSASLRGVYRGRSSLQSRSGALWPFMLGENVTSIRFVLVPAPLPPSRLLATMDRLSPLPFPKSPNAFQQCPVPLQVVAALSYRLAGQSQEAVSGGFTEAGNLGSVTEGFVASGSLAVPASVGRGRKWYFLFSIRNNER